MIIKGTRTLNDNKNKKGLSKLAKIPKEKKNEKCENKNM